MCFHQSVVGVVAVMKSSKMCLITVVLMLLATCFSSSAEFSFTTFPEPTIKDTWATGYDSLILTGIATNVESSGGCIWNISGSVGSIFSGGCRDETSKLPSFVKQWNCSYDSSTKVMTSNLHFTPLDATLSIRLRCVSGASQQVMVLNRNCPESLGSNLVVLSSNRTYNKPGNFRCTNDGELVYFNHSRKESNSTICSQDATWNGQKNMECWNAPNVDFKLSSMTGKEGDVLDVSCVEANHAYPPINSYKLFIDGKIINDKANSSVSLKREWNKKDAYCQVETNFTLLSDEKPVKSTSKTITVYYKPVAVNQSELVCEWSKNQQDARCDVTFYSNPSPVVTSLYKDEVDLSGSYYHLLKTDVQDRYIFSLRRKTVLKEDYGQYIVTVSNSLYIGTIKFSVVQSTSSQVNVGVIVGTVFGSLAAVALIAAGVCIVRRHQRKKTNDGKPMTNQDGKLDSNISPPPVVYINAPETETGQVQDHTGGNTVASNQQAGSTTYENVHHYEAVGSKKQDGGEDPYIDLNI